jgi:outer membrane immunogenic protein
MLLFCTRRTDISEYFGASFDASMGDLSQMKRATCVGVAAITAMTLAASAEAAEVARKAAMPAKAPVYEPPFTWTGFYAGINGGWGWGRSTWDVGGFGSTEFDINGGVFGGTLGYSWQRGPAVFGLEGDLDWSGIKGRSASSLCIGAVCETRNDWLATTRGRIGYAFGRMMPYITGGAAVGDVKTSTGLGSDTETRVGWTLGGGIEAAIVGPWSARIEYLHTDLGRASCGPLACGAASDVDFRSNLVRGGINYHF